VPADLNLDAKGKLSLADRWILDKLEATRQEVTQAMEEHRLNDAAMGIYGFFWHVYCNWYIELAKATLRGEGDDAEQTRQVLMHVLDQALRLLHPFMPFVTEEIWTQLPLASRGAPSIMVSQWPPADERRTDLEANRLLDQIIDVISALRTVRGENQIAPKVKMPVIVSAPDDDTERLVAGAAHYLAHLAGVDNLTTGVNLDRPPKTAVAVAGSCTVYVPLTGLVNVAEEVARLEKSMAKIDKDIAKFEKKLSNPGFLRNAPPEVVVSDKAKLQGFIDKRATYAESVERLKELAD
jgi:valyl-tRNA synthetase